MAGIARVERNEAERTVSRSLPARSSRIALLLEFLGNPYSDPIFSELTETAREHGVSALWLIGGLSHGDLIKRRRNFICDLATRDSVDGVLVVSLGNAISLSELTGYCGRYRPLPMSSVAVPWKIYPHVEVDNEPGMRKAIRHLVVTHGYRRVAFVRGPQASEEAELRYRVYREVLAENGIAFDPNLVAPGFFVVQSGVDAVALFLDQRKVLFDAVACANDGTAMGVIDELTARGIDVPRQVAVIGFDDADGCRFTEPPLTTVRQPIREQARAAFDLLLSQILGRHTSGAFRLETELVIRESCGCLPYGVADIAARAPAIAAPLPPALDAARDLTVREVAAAVTEIRLPRISSAPRLEDLCAAFASDITRGGATFLRNLEMAVHAAARMNNGFEEFHRLVSALEREMAGGLGDATPRARRIDELLDAARILVSSIAERVPAGLKHRYEDFADKLLRANQSIMATNNLGALAAALAKHMPAFGVPSCHICVYEGDAVPAEWSRVVLSWSAHQKTELPPEGLRFRSSTWLPPELAIPYRWSAHVAYPIDDGGHSIGYVVLEHGPREGHAYERLARQIDAAFQRIRMLEQLVEQARRRETADRERLEKEVRVARRIQSGLLPRNFDAPGLEVCAGLRSPAEMSSDYYDIIPTEDGCWIGAGVIGGDDLSKGLVTLMLQSVVSGLARNAAGASPAEILSVAKAVLADNMGRRGARDRVEVTILRYHARGTLAIAGEHGGVAVARDDGLEYWRASGRATEKVYDLAPGDLFMVHTRGAGAAHELEELPPWASTLTRVRKESILVARDALLDAWGESRGAVTLLVGRHMGATTPAPDQP